MKGRVYKPRHPAAEARAAAPAARSAAGHPASSRSRRYAYPQNVLLAAFGTPSPYYRTRRTFLYQPHHHRTTAPSALSYYYVARAGITGSISNLIR
jgi:hypothetical protein